MQNLHISCRCLAEDSKEMYKHLYRKCTAIVLLIKHFVYVTFSFPLPRGLLLGSLSSDDNDAEDDVKK